MRIASLVPSSTEMLFALGLGDNVVGVTHECDWPPAAAERPHLTATVLPDGLSAGEIDAAVKEIVGAGKALYTLNEEKLAELEPDLIVTQAVCDVCAVSYDDVVEVAARLPGPPQVIQQDPSSLADVLEDVTRLGAAAGIEERSAAVRAELEARLAAVRVAVAAAGAKSPEVAWEELAGLEPDAVVVMPCGWYADESLAQALAHRPQIDALGASRAFAVDAASTYSRPGPRLVDGTELLAHLLHPQLVPAPPGIDFHTLPPSG